MSSTATSPTPADSAQRHNPHHRGGRLLFEVPFAAAMSDAELACLGHALDISTHLQPKMRPDPNSPGVARLDDSSGLYLERGPRDGGWLLQARTWGRPAPSTVHEWQVLAAQAAGRLDPQVTLPDRVAPPPRPAVADRIVGEAANKHLAHLRRRLVGLA